MSDRTDSLWVPGPADPGRPLLDRSTRIILESQAPTGAYPAAQHYPQYEYCWLRDGAFIAQAMDLRGEHASARAFHHWVADTVQRHGHKVGALEACPPGRDRRWPIPDERGTLHTRFTLDGAEAPGDWGNFQLDGYGFWLTGLALHLLATGDDPEQYSGAVRITTRYLALTWDLPSYDCWEEYPACCHSTTWAAVAAGLAGAGRLFDDPQALSLSHAIRIQLLQHAVRDGVLLKFVGGPYAPVDLPPCSEPPGDVAVAGHERIGKPMPEGSIDGSSLLVLGPFGPFTSEDTARLVDPTLRRVEAELVIQSGTHRYLRDEYYGGGLWVVLSGALAWDKALGGDRAEACRVLSWIERQADEGGALPEQVSAHLLHPTHLGPWKERWGDIARPLLWSHAMYIIAAEATRPSPGG